MYIGCHRQSLDGVVRTSKQCRAAIDRVAHRHLGVEWYGIKSLNVLKGIVATYKVLYLEMLQNRGRELRTRMQSGRLVYDLPMIVP